MVKFKDRLISYYFFLFYFALSAWLPFLNLYLKEIGYSGTQVGIIAAVLQASSFFVIPAWGIFSDRRGIRPLLFIAIGMSSALIFGFQYITAFTAILLYMLCLAFFHHPIGSLLDSLSIHHTQHGSSLSFGALRVWGSIGWAAGSILMGRYLIHRELVQIFPAAALLYAILLLSLSALDRKDTRDPARHDFAIRHVAAVFGKTRIALLLLLLTAYGIGISPLYVFINLYYRDIGASNSIIGLAFSVQALSEIPFFFYGQRLLQRLGTARLLIVVILAAAVRLFLYSLISNPTIAVIVGVAQGLTLSLFWVAVVDLVHRLIPPVWRSTGQGLIWAFHLGAGVTLGNMTIGRLSDFFPMQRVMFFAAVFTLFVFILFIFYFRAYAIDGQAPRDEIGK